MYVQYAASWLIIWIWMLLLLVLYMNVIYMRYVLVCVCVWVRACLIEHLLGNKAKKGRVGTSIHPNTLTQSVARADKLLEVSLTRNNLDFIQCNAHKAAVVSNTSVVNSRTHHTAQARAGAIFLRRPLHHFPFFCTTRSNVLCELVCVCVYTIYSLNRYFGHRVPEQSRGKSAVVGFSPLYGQYAWNKRILVMRFIQIDIDQCFQEVFCGRLFLFVCGNLFVCIVYIWGLNKWNQRKIIILESRPIQMRME